MAAEGWEVTDVILRILGAFYAFAGLAAARAAIMSHLIDKAIAAISWKKTSARENALNIWLLIGAVTVFLSGVLLLGGLRIAVWAFTLSTLQQALYLFLLAPRYFDVEDPPDPTGRRQTTNAFVVYAAATAFVIWADWRGHLIPIAEASAPALAAIGAGIVAYAIYVLRRTWWTPRQSSGGFKDGFPGADDGQPSRPLHETTRVKVMAEYQCDPLWAIDEDLYGCFAPADLGLSPELIDDFGTWAAEFDASYDTEDFSKSLWSTDQQADHDARGRQLAIRLKRERPDLMVYVLEPEVGVVEVHADGVASAWRGAADLTTG